ncbi:M14 family metallocarboxypeptidase [Dokdonella sp.]|uniref:M14 family metallopeptidase n=1 Tax=Dokdonella sp. TaxID=2291710 RepID=UPI0025C2C08D|nr:M14 family metallocarboxypeptidase [Dokdonella sp.]MBX3688171.1 M14 family metallocarboxypeptidase [Dokdonella sp.]
MTHAFPIGTPGQPWGEAETARWRAGLQVRRSHAEDVLARIDALRERCEVIEYGHLDYPPQRFPLLALRSRQWHEELPLALVTGGVHGYETSGVHGALQFAERHLEEYAGRLNVLVVPCVSPWGYERIQRWNPQALDPNRAFHEHSPAPESAALMAFVEAWRGRFIVHIDLHETTDSDESEFRPALAARDGKPFEPGTIPDGFYLVDDVAQPQPAFQSAIIAAVERITHIAAADVRGEIIGSQMVAPGVIRYALRKLGLCSGITSAPYRTTTEVYPDSPRANPAQCNDAQVAAVRAALDFALAHPPH